MKKLTKLTRQERLKIALEVVNEEYEELITKNKTEYTDRAFGTVLDWLDLCLSYEKRYGKQK